VFSSIWNVVTSLAKKLRMRRVETSHDDTVLVRHARKKKIPSLGQFFHISLILSRTERILFVCAGILFLAGFLWGVYNLTGRYRTEVPAVGGSYTEGVIGAPQLINPLFSMLNDVDRDLVSLIYSGLLRYDSKHRLVPDLASSYEISEDKKIYTFKLKKDVVWHDEKPFTARDVVFTFELLQDTQVNSPLALGFQGVTVAAPDAETVIFTLPEPFSPFLSNLTLGVLPEHIWSSIPADQVRLAKRNLQPVGTGPYLFTRLVKDGAGLIHRVELGRFEKFYRTPAFVKDFAFEYFSDYESPLGVISALREQTVQGISFVPFALKNKVERKHVVSYTLHIPQYSALFFNLKSSRVSSVDTRLALYHALDRERIIRDVLDREATVLNGPVLEGQPGYDAALGMQEFSSDKANELFDKTFDRVTADEYRTLLRDERLKERLPAETVSTASVTSTEQITTTTTTVDNSALELQIDSELDKELNPAQLFYRFPKKGDKTDIIELKLVTAATPEYAKAAEIIAGYWQDIGIKVSVKLVDSKDLSREVLKGRDYDVLLYGVILGDDFDQYPFWHSTQISYPGLNLSGYVNRKVDDLLKKMRETQVEDEIVASSKEFQQTLLNDVPAIFLYTPTYTYVLSDMIKGIDVDRIGRPSDRFANVAEWYIKTKNEWKF